MVQIHKIRKNVLPIYISSSRKLFDYEVCCIVAQKGRCIQINILFSRCLLKKLLKITEILIYIILRFNCLTGVNK